MNVMYMHRQVDF